MDKTDSSRVISQRIQYPGVLILGILLVVLVTTIVVYRDSAYGQYGLGLILASGLMVLIFVRPQVGALLLVFTTVTNLSAIFTDQGLPSINKPLVAIVFVSVLASYGFRRKLGAIKLNQVEWLIIVYIFMTLISVLAAADKDTAFAATLDLTKDFVILITIDLALQDMNHWKRAVWIIIFVSAVLAAIGIFQTATHNTSFTAGGLSIIDTQQVTTGVWRPRVGGPIGRANFWGLIMAAFLPLAVYRLLDSDEPRMAVKVGAGIMASLIVVAILNTYSRGAFLAMIVSSIIIILERRVKPSVIGIITLIAMATALLAPTSYLSRLETLRLFAPNDASSPLQETSFRGRTSELKAGLAMFATNPIIGVGIGNYETNYQVYAARIGLEDRSEARQAHSLYVEVLAETGLLGAVAFGAVFWSLLSNLARVRAKLRSMYQQDQFTGWRTWISSVQISITTYLIGSTFLHGDYIRYLWLLTALGVAGIKISDKLLQEALSHPLDQTVT